MIDILFVCLCAIMSGMEDIDGIVIFGEERQEWLKQYIELKNGVPSYATYERVLRMLEPKELEKFYRAWAEALHDKKGTSQISIDGKTICGAGAAQKVHMVSAWAKEDGLCLGQLKTSEKSNEITAIPELVKMLDIAECVVSIDAMGCQKDIAEKIQKQGGDYLFAVKGNQGRLNKAFEEKFPLKELNNPEHDSYAISEKSHGREEIRLHIVCDVPDELIDFTFEWKGLKKLCVAVSFRSIIAEQKKEPEIDGQILYQFC